MLLAELVNLFQWALLAAAFCCALILWRHNAKRRSSPADHASEPDGDRPAGEVRVAADWLNDLEVRLFDLGREVEARVETRTAQLDRLIDAADNEIIRLSDLLAQAPRDAGGRDPDVVHRPDAQPQASASRRLTPARERIALHLSQAGYSVPEIAHIVGGTPEEIAAILRAA
jgi:hypothetical protein